MAEFRTQFFRSYVINQPELIKTNLKDPPDDFSKSNRTGEGVHSLLGNSVVLTNGETWKRQRRIIDPAFEGGILRETYPAMWEAAEVAATRLNERAGDVEEMVDQVVILLLAGHEASELALVWALYLRRVFPNVRKKWPIRRRF